ncbi:ATP-binding protein [Wukongibacter baidiensis]|uniref:sensor histidine kinase n=1 Tax=Wukongibacter baidiensis TaxID=1723361 RepID=UPI003D7FBA3B
MRRKIDKNLNVNKAAAIIYFVNISQIILFLGFIFYSYLSKEEAKNLISDNLVVIFIILCIAFFMNTYINLRDVNALKRLHEQNLIQKEMLTQIEDLNNTMRGQRHDFLNHLQVVFSLIEMNEYTESRDYIEKIYEDIKKVNRVIKTSKPAINALLQAKQLDCEDRGILVKLQISTRLENLKVPSWEMCRVLGNIVDNAMDATEGMEKRFIEIEILEETNNYRFVVRNNGKMISEDIHDKIFLPGFTTKSEDGHGMGLSISKGIVERYGGRIFAESKTEITVFYVSIPFE